MATRRNGKKRNIRKTIKQKGGMFSLFSKTPINIAEEQLKKDALENLTSNGKTIKTVTNNETVGKYTYGVEQNMLGGHVPEFKIYVKLPIGLFTDH